MEGQSGPGNSRSGPLSSLAQGSWETVILEQHGHDFRDFGEKMSYSWIAYKLHKGVAPVLGLSATDFHSETSFWKLRASRNYVFQGKLDYSYFTSLIFVF